MEQWYALYTASGREQEAKELLERAVSHALWSCCRVPGKIKVFRSGGILRLLEDVMFPGYLFIKTGDARRLSKELERSGKFPRFAESPEKSGKELLTPVEAEDLRFLQNVCGENLEHAMGVSRIIVDGENRVVGAEGALEHYRTQIVKLNLHKRFAVVEVELFNRRQSVVFGVSLEKDQSADPKQGGRENRAVG